MRRPACRGRSGPRPGSSATKLLQPDIDRIAPSLEVGFEHFPAFQNAGIKQIINGPFTFAPDGNPLIGPIRGLPGFWSACGVMAGFSQGGGVGLALANWITEADPGFDVWAMDIARYGDWTSMSYTNPKVQENYSRRFSIKFPNEELPAARPFKTTPIYDRLSGHGRAVGRQLGPRGAALVLAGRLERRVLLAPLDRLPARRQRGPHRARGCGLHGDLRLFEVHGPPGPARGTGSIGSSPARSPAPAA